MLPGQARACRLTHALVATSRRKSLCVARAASTTWNQFGAPAEHSVRKRPAGRAVANSLTADDEREEYKALLKRAKKIHNQEELAYGIGREDPDVVLRVIDRLMVELNLPTFVQARQGHRRSALAERRASHTMASTSASHAPRTASSHDRLGPEPCAALALEGVKSQTAVHRQVVSKIFMSYHAQIMRLFVRRGFSQEAFNYVCLLPRDAKLLTSLMSEFSRHGRLTDVQEAVRLRELLGWPQDRFTVTAVVSKAAEVGAYDVACDTFERALKRHVFLDAHAFNAMLCAHASAANPGGFQQTWRLMVQAGIQPDQMSHASRAKLLVATRPPHEVYEFVRDLVHVHSGDVEPHTISELFTATQSDPNITFADLLDFWGLAQRGARIRGNQRVLSAFTAACSRVELDANDVETLFSIVASSRGAGIKAEVGVLTNMLTVCARNGYAARAIDLWRMAEEDHVRLNPQVMSALLTCCASGELEHEGLRKLAAMVERVMHDKWLDACAEFGPTSSRAYMPSYRTVFNAMIHYCASTREWKRGLAVFKFMQESGPYPDRITYNSVLHMCGCAGRVAVAQEILFSMHRQDLPPDVRAYGCLLDACAKAGDPERARSVIRDMRSRGVQPNSQCYTCCMDACVKEGGAAQLDKVMEIFDEMRAENLLPTAVSYGCALAACEASGNADMALQLYTEACDGGVLPTDECHNILIKVFAAAGRVDEALEQIKALMRKHGNMQLHTINSLTRALCEQYIDRALKLLNFMRTRGMRPCITTFRALVTGCAKASYADRALDLYREMRNEGYLPTSRSGSALVECLSSSRSLYCALLVIQDMQACAHGESFNSQLLRTRIQAFDPIPLPVSPSPAAEGVNASAVLAELVASLRVVTPFSLPHDRLRKAAAPQENHEPRHAGKDGKSEKGPRPTRRRTGSPLRKGDVLPAPAAMASLVIALALEGHVKAAMALYQHVRSEGLSLVLTHAQMYEQLLELNCRWHLVADALVVFDDWKAARDQLAHEAATAALETGTAVTAPDDDVSVSGRPRGPPRLSTVSLAFLEACCHAEMVPAWRMYDVCAAMRDQQEQRRQQKLLRPVKRSHHFLDSL